MTRSTHCLLVCVGGLGLAATPVWGQFDVPITSPAPLNSTAGNDTGADFTPQLTTDGAGNWVAVWESQEPAIAGGIGTDQDILFARSSNNGASWTDPAPLNSTAGNDTGGDIFPQLTTDGAGNWVAVWASNEPAIAGGIGTDTDILVARSSNNGASWTDPAPLNSTAGNDTGIDSRPQLTTDGAGNWVAVWHSNEPAIAGGLGTDFDILVARSSNNGASWTDPAPLNSTAGTDMGDDFLPKLTTDGAGNWVAVWGSTEPTIAGGIGTDQDILVARSSNNGASWTDPTPLNSTAGNDMGSDSPPQLTTDGAGNWVAVWSSSEPAISSGIGTDFDILIARSSNNGASWTDPAPLNSNAGNDTGEDTGPQLTTDGGGNWVAVWSSSESAIAGGIGPDLDILVARSSNNGASWTDPAPLNSTAGNDTGFDETPQLTTDGAGNWVAVWQSGEPAIAGGLGTDLDIFVARFALPDCNQNEIGDGQDIADGVSDDCDENDVPDECETDSDDDGVIDPCDDCPDDPLKIEPGVCGCGVADTDSNGDGVPDCVDNCPDDPDKSDPGLCGCGVSDTDSDGDGAPDCIDNCINEPNADQADADGDGFGDACDGCPDDSQKAEPGECGCGVSDSDANGDGVPDCLDNCPDDPSKSEPGVCGCGVADTDSDGDGMVDCVDNCPDDANPDQEDSDGDGFGDACDRCPGDPEKSEPGEEGCTVVDGEQPPSSSGGCGGGMCGMGALPALPLTLAGMFVMKGCRRRCLRVRDSSAGHD